MNIHLLLNVNAANVTYRTYMHDLAETLSSNQGVY